MSKLKVDVPVTIVYSASCTGIVASSINMVKSPTPLNLLSGFLSITFFILMMIVVWKFRKLEEGKNNSWWKGKMTTVKDIPSYKIIPHLLRIFHLLDWRAYVASGEVIGRTTIDNVSIEVSPASLGRLDGYKWNWRIRMATPYPNPAWLELYLATTYDGKYIAVYIWNKYLPDLEKMMETATGPVKDILDTIWRYCKLSSHILKNDKEVVA